MCVWERTMLRVLNPGACEGGVSLALWQDVKAWQHWQVALGVLCWQKWGVAKEGETQGRSTRANTRKLDRNKGRDA